MTLPRWRALRTHWSEYPPVEVLMAAQMKYKPPRTSKTLTHMPSMAQTDANLSKYFGIRPGQTITG